MKRTWALAAVVCLQAACSGDGNDLDPGSEQVQGTLAVVLSASSAAGLAAVRMNVIGPQHDCGDRGLAEAVVPIIPTVPFVDAQFVLPPGQYTVCLHALEPDGQERPDCSGSNTRVTILAGATTSLSTTFTCRQPRGALTVHVDLNNAPVLERFEIVPAPGHITRCSLVQLRVQASDPDGDALTYRWSWLGAVPLVLFPLDQPETRLLADPGHYDLRVEVSDSKGATTSLDFPIDVAPCP